MSSVGTSNPFAPNTALKDCSQGICSIYCPQWCYIIYSPPPPSFLTGDDKISDDDDSSAFQFSPLIVAVIGILASTFILITYYTIISRFCRHRIDDPTASQLDHDDRDSGNSDSAQGSNTGLDEALIKSITVCKYTKNGLVEGNDCSVCLSEFQENESLRLLPKCNHAFHLPCIDPWLKSHSSCPLCRSNISSNVTDSVTEPPEIARMNVNMNAFEYEQRSDVVVVVQSSEELNLEEVVVSFGDEQDLTKISVGESRRRVSVADILNECDDDLELQREMI